MTSLTETANSSAGATASPTDPPSVQPGQLIFPGYTAVSLLSRGNRLDVYDAWSASRRCRCVIKVPRPDRATEPSVVHRLRLEGQLLADLDHPHWVRLYEIVETAADLGLVLETLTGNTLAALLDDHRRLGPGDVAILGAQLASALGYLHDRGWLHLDLTPGNVVVSAGVLRLIDLSIAQRPGRVSRSAGTDGYRSPEQRAGLPVSTASDVWGLGRLLAEALSGDAPVEAPAGNPDAPLRRRQGWRRLPTELVDLVEACLRPEPSARPTLDEVLIAVGGAP